MSRGLNKVTRGSSQPGHKGFKIALWVRRGGFSLWQKAPKPLSSLCEKGGFRCTRNHRVRVLLFKFYALVFGQFLGRKGLWDRRFAIFSPSTLEPSKVKIVLSRILEMFFSSISKERHYVHHDECITIEKKEKKSVCATVDHFFICSKKDSQSFFFLSFPVHIIHSIVIRPGYNL